MTYRDIGHKGGTCPHLCLEWPLPEYVWENWNQRNPLGLWPHRGELDDKIPEQQAHRGDMSIDPREHGKD